MNKSDKISNIKIGFMGTPDFSVPVLESLTKGNFDISCVFTQKGKPAGRGMKNSDSAVFNYASENNLYIRTPEKFNKDEMDFISAQKLDVILVVAYGMILPEEILKLPKYGCINIHASLLPFWRGAAPIQRSIMAGDNVTGLSYMVMEKGLDVGPVIKRQEIKINSEDNFLMLHNTLSNLAADSVNNVINDYLNGKLKKEDQDNSKASYANKIEKEEARINWNNSAQFIKNLINGLSPNPCAWTMTHEGKRLKILKVRVEEISEKVGFIINDDSIKDGFIVGCGNHSVRVLRVQPEGKKEMNAKDYLRGNKLIFSERAFE
ncbi:MAG: methionyl-tRNA formyltransferase [Pseudomonadota bacterium]|nr:methionyl-tRNA formyltransferase [Pseudomonadota bacterium]MEC9392578.1 methionyl-tRNA formyltransferase [Pseudomonadota bacterium]